MGLGLAKDPENIRILLCGDVMTGRGIDQALPHPGDGRIHDDRVVAHCREPRSRRLAVGDDLLISHVGPGDGRGGH